MAGNRPIHHETVNSESKGKLGKRLTGLEPELLHTPPEAQSELVALVSHEFRGTGGEWGAVGLLGKSK